MTLGSFKEENYLLDLETGCSCLHLVLRKKDLYMYMYVAKGSIYVYVCSKDHMWGCSANSGQKEGILHSELNFPFFSYCG